MINTRMIQCLGFDSLPTLARSFWNSRVFSEVIYRNEKVLFGLEIKKPGDTSLKVMNQFITSHDRDRYVFSRQRIKGTHQGNHIDIDELTIFNRLSISNKLTLEYRLDIYKPNFAFTTFRNNLRGDIVQLIPDNFWMYLDDDAKNNITQVDELLKKALD